MTTITQYGIGRYRTGERHVVMRSGKHRHGQNPLIIANHGSGADATQFSPEYWNGLWPVIDALLEEGYVVMSIDGGTVLTNWGNADQMTAIDAAKTWAQDLVTAGIDRPRAKAGKIGMMGWSMGGLATLNWHVRNPASIAGSYLFAPVSDLDIMQANPTYQAAINTAYGGNYAANATLYDPADRMADYNATPPIEILHSDDDPTVAYSQSTAFDAVVVPCTLRTVTGRGHTPFMEPTTPDLVLNFFKGVLPVG